MDISDFEKNEHQRQVVEQINEGLNSMQMRYDAKLLSIMLADRAAFVFSLLIKAGRMTEKEALAVWALTSERILEKPASVTPMNLVDGEIYDPAKVN